MRYDGSARVTRLKAHNLLADSRRSIATELALSPWFMFDQNVLFRRCYDGPGFRLKVKHLPRPKVSKDNRASFHRNPGWVDRGLATSSDARRCAARVFRCVRALPESYWWETRNKIVALVALYWLSPLKDPLNKKPSCNSIHLAPLKPTPCPFHSNLGCLSGPTHFGNAGNVIRLPSSGHSLPRQSTSCPYNRINRHLQIYGYLRTRRHLVHYNSAVTIIRLPDKTPKSLACTQYYVLSPHITFWAFQLNPMRVRLSRPCHRFHA
jgi:hypothetical protein